MKIALFWRSAILIICFSMGLSTFSLAQSLPLNDHQMYLPHKVRCNACAFLTRQYNEAREELLDEEEVLDDLEDALAQTEKKLKTTEADLEALKKQFIRQPSSALAKHLQALEAEQQSLNRQFVRQERSYEKEEQYYQKLVKNLETIAAHLNDCEVKFCHLAANHPLTPALSLYYLTQIQLGLLMGQFTNTRTGYITTPTESFNGSHRQNNFIFGPQARLMLGAPETMHAFFLVNALTMFHATNQLIRTRTDVFSNSLSRQRLQTAWIGHLLIGLQSALLYSNLSVSGGVGGAVVNQELKTSIAEDVVTTKTKTQTSLAPSWMVSLDYQLCKSCIGGHALSLSGQLSADRYASMNSVVNTPLGNNNQSRVNESWQYSEALVLSMHF